MSSRKTAVQVAKATRVHRCRYCGHEGTARGKAAGLDYERAWTGPARYSCKDADACGERIRRQHGVTVEDLDDGLPF